MALNQAAGLGGMLKDGHKTYEGIELIITYYTFQY